MESKTIAEIVSLIGSVFSFFSMGIYFLQVVRGASTPNPATWLIWLVIGIINCITYFYVVNESFVKAMILVVVTTGILAVTVYSLVRGKFSRVGPVEMIALAAAVGVGILWKSTGDPVLANLVLQLVYVISFAPTIVGLHRRELKEQHLPWTLALVAYACMITAVFLDWSPNHWVALAHPVINGLIGNGAIVYCSFRNSKNLETKK